MKVRTQCHSWSFPIYFYQNALKNSKKTICLIDVEGPSKLIRFEVTLLLRMAFRDKMLTIK